MRTQKTLLSIADFPSENTVYQRTGILKHFFNRILLRKRELFVEKSFRKNHSPISMVHEKVL